MRVIVAMDSFKGSLTSLQAGSAVKEAALRCSSATEVTVLPLADGGEGTVEALSAGLDGTTVTLSVTGPEGIPVTAKYCILQDRHTAVIEMAAGAGLTLVPPSRRNPMETTTFGVGEMILDAIKKGCRRFIVGIGGSATNDGGTGMLSALGFSFLDADGMPISPGARGLERLSAISVENAIPALKDCTFRIACDVKNPLCGSNGCSAVFAPQKGGTPEMIEKMDKWLNQYAEIARSVSEHADPEHPGSGAAGGLGFAFLCFTNAVLEPGVDIVLDETHLEEHIRNADLVITGEGRLDSQTVMGKAPIGVAKLAKKHNKPVIAFSGCVTEDAAVCNEHGIDAFFPIVRGVTTTEEAMNPENARRNLTDTACQVFRLLQI